MHFPNTFRTKLLSLSALLLLSMFSTQSFAGCGQGKLTGIWYVGGINLDTAFGGGVGAYCKLKVDQGGPILGGSSSCQVSEADNRVKFNVTGGELTVTGACQMSGYFRLCQDEDCFRFGINGARLADNGQVFMWTGRRSGELDNFQYLVGIKQVQNQN